MELKFIPLDYGYFDYQGRNFIQIIGRNEKNQRICVIDSFEPFFWVILKENLNEKKISELRKKIESIKLEDSERRTKVEKTEVHEKNFLGKKVKAIKIFITNYKDGHAIADKLDFPEIECRREYDINLITKYILDKKITPLDYFKVSGEILSNSEEFSGIDSILDVDICIKAEKIQKIEHEKEIEPKILAFDIEADEFEIGQGEIVMISLVSKNFQKVLTWKKVARTKDMDFVEFYKDEASMIEAFVENVKKISPDILVGYFSDGFDLPYLRARAEFHKVDFSLGIDNKKPVFARGKYPSARITGIVHIDLFRFIETIYSQYLKSETLGLDEVASELLSENKIDFDHKHSSKISEEEWLDYFKYNLQDSVLTYKLAFKLWPDMLEFSKIIQEPLFEITRAGMSQLLENYIMHNLEKYNEIIEKRPIYDEIGKRKQREKVEGAFVLVPKAGLYENLAIFDFTSMHTSIIISFNISKSTLLENKEKESYESPEVELEGKKQVFHFSQKPGFLPEIVKELVDKRKKFKKEYKNDPNPITKARSNAVKLLTAAVHGYIGFFGARYYSLESSASILGFVRKFNKETIEKVNNAGYHVIYGDTDSVAFTLGEKTKEQVKDFLKKLNSELPGIMEMELEDFYKRGIWVTKRTGDFGAKKKYALIDEKGKLKIRGFETVRRDWCALARELQDEVLDMILKEGNAENALKLVKETIEKLKSRKISKEKLIIKTQLKKPLEEYKSISPHVTIAKRMLEQDMPVNIGMLIKFYIAEPKSNKKELVRARARLPDEPDDYDIDYYLDHQILPAIENIFEVFHISVDDLKGKKQMKLGEF
jgi:DNA polymerase I/DNA polymerase-2